MSKHTFILLLLLLVAGVYSMSTEGPFGRGERRVRRAFQGDQGERALKSSKKTSKSKSKKSPKSKKPSKPSTKSPKSKSSQNNKTGSTTTKSSQETVEACGSTAIAQIEYTFDVNAESAGEAIEDATAVGSAVSTALEETMAEPCTRRLTTRRRLMDTTNAPIRGFKVVSVEQTNEKCDAPSDMKCFRMKVTVDVEIDEEGNIVDTLGDIISILPQVFDVLPLQAKFVTAAGIFEGQVYSLNAPVPNRMSPVAIVFIVFAALSVVVVAAAFGYRRHQQRKAAASAFAGEKTDETPDLGAAPTLSDIAESSDAGESRP